MARVKKFIVALLLLLSSSSTVFAYQIGTQTLSQMYEQFAITAASDGYTWVPVGVVGNDLVFKGTSQGGYVIWAGCSCASGLSSDSLTAFQNSTSLVLSSNGQMELPSGTISSSGSFTPSPLAANANLTDLATSGILRDASGAQVGVIPPSDLVALTSGASDGMGCANLPTGDRACTFNAPSGASYTSIVATGGGAPSAAGQAVLETYLANHRALGENVWSTTDLEALARARSSVASGEAVTVNTTTGYVSGISANSSGATQVNIELFSSPVPNVPTGETSPISTDMASRIASGGGGSNSPNPPNTSGARISSAPAPSRGGSSPAVNYVEESMETISTQPNISSQSGALEFHFGGGGAGGSASSPTTVSAVNSVTGQQVGSVTVSGQPLTEAQVAEAVSLGVQHGLRAYVGGGGLNSGTVSASGTTGGGTLPTGDAVRAGTGSGSSVLSSSSPFYAPPTRTLASVWAFHQSALLATPFVSGLNSIAPTFGAGSTPIWCFDFPRFHVNRCVDFTQYADMFALLRALLLIGTAFQCYRIVLGR